MQESFNCHSCGRADVSYFHASVVRPHGEDPTTVCDECAAAMHERGETQFAPHAECAFCGAADTVLAFHREPSFVAVRCLEGCRPRVIALPSCITEREAA